MEKIATTFRIDPIIKAGLQKLSDIKHVSLNRLANEAIAQYVDRQTAAVEDELEATLADLRAYRRNDPGFSKAIAAFADAEATVDEDPAEGKIVEAGPGKTEAALLKVLDD